MNIREIQIDPELNIAATLAKANKLADRATKKGLSNGYQISTENRIETNSSGDTHERTYLIIEGSPAKYNGWTFAALVQWTNGESVVFASPHSENAPVDRETLVEGGCDHCGVNRARKTIILVENEAGERKQVGKSCAKDYLGHDFPVSWFSKNEDVFSSLMGYSGSGKYLLSLKQVLNAAASIVRQRGFVRSLSDEATPTKDLVKILLGDKPSNAHQLKLWRELHEGFDQEKDPATAIAAFEFAQDMEGETDYALNVKAVMSSGIDGNFDSNHLGLVVSIISVHAKHLEKKALDANTVNEEFGKVGDKVTLTVETVSCHAFENQWGISYINVFTSGGFLFKWFTGTTSFEEGETFDIKGTIKGHEEFNGKVSTVLTRCKKIDS